MPRAVRIQDPPPGFLVNPNFVETDEERDILARLAGLEFHPVELHGVITKRTVHHFGWRYGYESWRIERTEPLPAWLRPLRDRAATWSGAEPSELVQCLA